MEDGLFLFDFWYGPGVLTDPPTLRRKIMEDKVTHLERSASPVHRINDNIVEVHYVIDLINKVVINRIWKNATPCATGLCLNCAIWRMKRGLRLPQKANGCLRHVPMQQPGMHGC